MPSPAARRAFFEQSGETLIVSDFAAAEFASVIARVARMNLIQGVAAREIFDAFDLWRSRSTDEEDVASSDIKAATAIVRRLDLNIRAPDAINLAVASRLGASIATFDRGMAQNAGILGIPIAAA
jgi:predicted nucleic acid-binding protein